jgi:hypothetical protein
MLPSQTLVDVFAHQLEGLVKVEPFRRSAEVFKYIADTII